jgi:SAM-dependent methyltransferase
MPVSEGYGRYLDRLFLEDRLAVAVRHRKDTIRDWLQSELDRAEGDKKELKILNIGCGSCREWYELLAKVDPERLQLTCIDFDQVALNYARRRLSDRQRRVDLKFVRDNALRLAVRQDNQARFGLQDIIYSFGLYDYLTDKTLKRLLKNQYDLLKPGGRMVLTFKDKTKYNCKKHAWFCDWYFEQRSEGDIFKLLHEIGIDQRCITTVWEPSGTVVFFQIGKDSAA